MVILGFLVGSLITFLVMAIWIGAKANENPCDTCKYKKVGVDILTGELQFPCARCCNQYPNLYSEVTQ